MAEATHTGEPAGAARSAVRETADSLASVFRNPRLRKIQLALAGSLIGDWATATATIVFAYGVGGAKAVGLFYTVRLALMAVASPLAATFADRTSRRGVMVVCDLTRLVLFVGAAACLWIGTPPWPVFALATAAAVVSSAFRPAQNAWMPALADSPEELTAANGAASSLESLAFFIGPALGAALVAATNVPTVFLLNAATFAWSAFLVASIRPSRTGPTDVTDDRQAGSADAPQEGFLRETRRGFGAVARDRTLTMVAALVCTQTVVAGASVVFVVEMAVRILGTGPEGVGYLDSALGVGAIIGGVVAIGRARKRRLASDLALGVVLWSIPLVAVRLDRALAVPPGVDLLARIAMFAPLGPATVEALARKLTQFRVPTGVVIVAEGQESERFFIVESGSVRVTSGDRILRHQGAGDFFGEIGLLRDIPRTATVTTEADTVLQVLEREDFLSAVTGQEEARTIADSVVSRRIAV